MSTEKEWNDTDREKPMYVIEEKLVPLLLFPK